MKTYLEYTEVIRAIAQRCKNLPLGGFPACERLVLPFSAPKVLLFSPHPDDECITGLLPLRLMREIGMKIVNVPVTFGSNVERQPGRAQELDAACGFLGWDVYQRHNFQGLEKTDVVEILKTVQPEIIFVPHSKDWNSRHISTHFLVMDALTEMGDDFSCTVIETEYWQAMDTPNLMVEADTQTLADMICALSFHVEEVRRNPYHLTLPAWMQDNVRRGGELVGGQGGVVPDFTFATLYRLRRWESGGLIDVLKAGRMVAVNESFKGLF